MHLNTLPCYYYPMDSDIYDVATIRNLLADINNLDIPKENKELAAKLQSKLEAKGVVPRTIARHMYYMRLYLKCLGNVSALKATKEDVEAAVYKIRQTKTRERRTGAGMVTMPSKPLAQETVRKTLVTVKLLYKLFLGDGEFFPKQVSWIHYKRETTSKLRPNDMLDEDTLAKLIQATHSSMYKAMWALFGEIGLRPFELLNLKRKDVDLTQVPGMVTVDGKNGDTRTVPIIKAFSYVDAYLQEMKLKPDDPLWVTWYGYEKDAEKKPLEYDTMRRQLSKVVKRAGLDSRRINPYLFRHSAITIMADSGLSDQQIKKMVGHRPGSPMLNRYSHLGTDDLKRAVLKENGMQEATKITESPLKPKECGRCKTLNSADSLYCRLCSSPLALATALETERHIKNGEDALEAVLQSDDPKKLKELLSRLYLKLDYEEKRKKR